MLSSGSLSARRSEDTPRAGRVLSAACCEQTRQYMVQQLLPFCRSTYQRYRLMMASFSWLFLLSADQRLAPICYANDYRTGRIAWKKRRREALRIAFAAVQGWRPRRACKSNKCEKCLKCLQILD